jgi:pimeloyl-ACP methyl ester carboxylesterase
MIFSTKKEKILCRSGEGHPLVLLHGLMGGLSNFDKMVDFFSDRGFKVYVPQLPIYDLPVLNTNLTTLAKYIIKFIESHIEGPVTIVGNSMGGHVGLILTLARPDLVKILFLQEVRACMKELSGTVFQERMTDLISERKQKRFFMIQSCY